MVTNGCKKFELPASIATGIAKHNTEGNNEFPIPLLYNLCMCTYLTSAPPPFNSWIRPWGGAIPPQLEAYRGESPPYPPLPMPMYCNFASHCNSL